MKPDEFGATGKLEGGVFKPYDAEVPQAQDEIQPEGADIQELLDANHSLKTEVDRLTELVHRQEDHARKLEDAITSNEALAPQVADLQAKLDSTHEGAGQLGAALNEMRTKADSSQAELESTQSDFIRYQNDLSGLKARVAELEAGAAAESDTVTNRYNVDSPAESVLDASAPDNHGVAKPDAINPPAEASKPAKPTKGGAK